MQALVQLDDIWVEKEKLIAQAAKKDKARMDELNKRLATVSEIRELFWFRVSPVSCPIQRPPLTLQETAAQVKVTVAVYFQSEEDEGAKVVGDFLGKS